MDQGPAMSLTLTFVGLRRSSRFATGDPPAMVKPSDALVVLDEDLMLQEFFPQC